MKKVFLSLTFLLFFVLSIVGVSSASNITIAWDYDPAHVEFIEGFRLYCSNTSGSYSAEPTSVIPKDVLEYTAEMPAVINTGVIYCVMTAYKGDKQSVYSNEAKGWHGDLSPPKIIKFCVDMCIE